ncbi:MAG: ATP-binding protein, partial [Vampirovibrionia bacterium]
MQFNGFLRKEIVNKLLNNNGNINSIKNIIGQIKASDSSINFQNLNPYIFINRKDEIIKLSNFLDDETQQLLLFGGIQGSGKSTLIKTSLALCNEDILIYWYECSKITNLDDILLSLCGFFERKINKKETTQNQKNVISIDEKLISYLKTLNRNLIIVLDSIENLVSPQFTIEDEELK